MDAGLMRHRITVQTLGEKQNERGEIESDWVDVWKGRASINPLSGRDFVAAMQEHAQVTHKVTIRYNPAIKTTMRIMYGDRVFDILHIIDTWEQHREMVLMCKELIS